jgi:hypothetical protein
MTTLDDLLNNPSLVELTLRIIYVIISVLTVGGASLVVNKKIDIKEKNEYIKILKENCYIKETFLKINRLPSRLYFFGISTTSCG